MGKELNMNDVLSQYIKTRKGNIYQVLGNPKSPKTAILRSGRTQIKTTTLDIRQGLVDGRYQSINEHEWRKWVKEDNEYIDELTKKLLRRIILTQLLIELDDELIEDYQDDKYFRGLLERTNKASERIAVKQYNNLYKTNKQVLVNMMNYIDNLTKSCSKLDLEDYPYVVGLVDKYIANPNEYRKATVELVEIK